MRPLNILAGILLTVGISRATDLLDAPGPGYRELQSPLEFRDPLGGMPTIGDRTAEVLQRLKEIEARLSNNEKLAKREGVPQAAAPQTSKMPEDIFIRSYIGFQHAEKAIARDDFASATWILTEVYRILSELQQQHPAWQPTIVEYRKQRVLDAMGKAPVRKPASKEAADRELKEGIAFYNAGKLDEAVNAITRALALNYKSAIAHLFLSKVAGKKGWKEAAAKELEIAKTLDGTLDLEEDVGAPKDRKNPQ
jgi:tetratricopeptide (TPR) repeat protein